jgi:hypothetical protein
MASAGGRSPGFRVFPRAFPGSDASQWLRAQLSHDSDATDTPGHSGGTAPVLHRTSLFDPLRGTTDRSRRSLVEDPVGER